MISITTTPTSLATAIEQLVAIEFNLTVAELHLLQPRPIHIARPRQVAMTLMHESGYTWAACAIHFGLGDHTTAIWAAKTVNRLSCNCDTFAARLHRLRTVIAAPGFQPLGSSQTSV